MKYVGNSAGCRHQLTLIPAATAGIARTEGQAWRRVKVTRLIVPNLRWVSLAANRSCWKKLIGSPQQRSMADHSATLQPGDNTALKSDCRRVLVRYRVRSLVKGRVFVYI